MSDAQPDSDAAPLKRSRILLILGVLLALAGGGAGFYATWTGMILGGETAAEKGHAQASPPGGRDIDYVAIDPLVISMHASSNAKHLMFRANLEVRPEAKEDVEKILPRIVDVLNGYLRALEPGDLEDPSALTRLRAQMLRRVQVVTGPDRVNDLLIMEFVLN